MLTLWSEIAWRQVPRFRMASQNSHGTSIKENETCLICAKQLRHEGMSRWCNGTAKRVSVSRERRFRLSRSQTCWDGSLELGVSFSCHSTGKKWSVIRVRHVFRESSCRIAQGFERTETQRRLMSLKEKRTSATSAGGGSSSIWIFISLTAARRWTFRKARHNEESSFLVRPAPGDVHVKLDRGLLAHEGMRKVDHKLPELD